MAPDDVTVTVPIPLTCGYSVQTGHCSVHRYSICHTPAHSLTIISPSFTFVYAQLMLLLKPLATANMCERVHVSDMSLKGTRNYVVAFYKAYFQKRDCCMKNYKSYHLPISSVDESSVMSAVYHSSHPKAR